MSSFLYRNSLSIVLFSVFALTIVGQALAGWKALEQELAIDGLPPLRLLDYLGTGHFRSALFENWESEFLATERLRAAHRLSASEGLA